MGLQPTASMSPRGVLFFIFLLLRGAPLLAQNDELDSLEKVLPQQTGSDKISTLNAISWHYRQANTTKAMELAKSALKLSTEVNYLEGEALSLQSVGAVYEATSNFDSALLFFNKSLAIKQALGDTTDIAASLNNIAMVYDQLGKDEMALTNYFQALRMYEAVNDLFSEAMVLGNIGIVYKKQKDYAKVLTYYERALEIYENEQSVFGSSVVQGNIASILIILGNYNQAIEVAKKSLQGYESLGYSRLMAYPLGNLAIAYDSLKELSVARDYYKQALALHKNNNNTAEVAFTLKNLAGNELASGEYTRALAHATEAYHLASSAKATDVLMQALVIITRCEQQLGNYEKAFGYQQQYIDLRDKAFEEEKTKATLELEAKYETEKKDRELELQRLSLVEKDLEIQKSRVAQLALGGALLLLFVLGLLVRARTRLSYQRKLDQEKLAKQEELLRAVISSVEGERKRFSEDLHDSFGQLISVLKMNVDSLSAAPPSASADRQRMFDQSVSVLNDMYGELKNVCFNLMPKALIQHGLPVGVNELVARINHTGKLRAESHFFDLDERLVDIQEISLYRIVQEWTNNILKYSDAKNLFIQITRDEEEITLTIEDDGMGFDDKILKMGQGNGWKNLQSRTNLMKGTIDLDTAPGRKGTMLTVNVPAILKGDQSKTDPDKVETLLTYALF